MGVLSGIFLGLNLGKFVILSLLQKGEKSINGGFGFLFGEFWGAWRAKFGVFWGVGFVFGVGFEWNFLGCLGFCGLNLGKFVILSGAKNPYCHIER